MPGGFDPKAALLRLYREAFERGDLDVVDQLVAPTLVDHEAVLPDQPAGREGLKAAIRALRDGFPDLRAEVQEELADGDRVMARVELVGTHRGLFAGIAATGRKVRVPSIDIVRFEGERIVEHWGITDNLLLMQQLTSRVPGGKVEHASNHIPPTREEPEVHMDRELEVARRLSW